VSVPLLGASSFWPKQGAFSLCSATACGNFYDFLSLFDLISGSFYLSIFIDSM
jgi:hypothetical protein